MKVLISGGAGFIGSHLINDILLHTDWDLTVIDRLDISGSLSRLAQVGAAKNPRVRFFYHDLRAEISDYVAGKIGKHNYILHLGAATHVDRSIEDPMSFVYDNVVATGHMLNYARRFGCDKFLYFSTDEVFGPAPDGVRYKEWDRYKSGNPYAATKAGAEELAISFHNTYGLPVIVTHTMNVLGPMQHFEKYVPSTIKKILLGEEVSVHSDKSQTKAGSRFYIHAASVANAVRFLIDKGEYGDKYNIVGEREIDNLQIAKFIEKFIGKPLKYSLVSWHASRPGHDLRYALCGEKMAKLGWTPPVNIEESIQQTVQWYLENPTWLGLQTGHASIATRSSLQPLGFKNIAETSV